jgi:hypothetical protein
MGTIVVLIVGHVVRPPFIAGAIAVALVALTVFALNRHSLQIVDTYPELGRFRLMRRIFGDPSAT